MLLIRFQWNISVSERAIVDSHVTKCGRNGVRGHSSAFNDGDGFIGL
jgi:hypothetical protein